MIVDFHSHVLPGMDDGSAGVEESLAMLRMEAAQGITHVVATPHFYAHHDSPKRFLARRKEAEDRLRNEMAKWDGLPQLLMGAEVYFFSGISESDAIWDLTIGNGDCLLLEMPNSPWSNTMYQEIGNIHERHGLTPVIAHIDRYIAPFRTHGIPERLAQLPVLVQANAEFFLRGLRAGMAMRMLKEDQIHLLGSDCHDLHSRKPNLGSAMGRIEHKLGKPALNRMEQYGARALKLENTE